MDDLSALALQKLSGALTADIALDGASGAQNATIDMNGSGIRARELGVERLSAKLSGRDLLRRPALDGVATLENLRVGKELVSSATVRARPAGVATALDLAINARGFAIVGAATLTPGEHARVDLSALTIQRGGQRIALAGPASVSLGGGEAELKGVSVNLGAGRLDLAGKVGDHLDRPPARAQCRCPSPPSPTPALDSAARWSLTPT